MTLYEENQKSYEKIRVIFKRNRKKNCGENCPLNILSRSFRYPPTFQNKYKNWKFVRKLKEIKIKFNENLGEFEGNFPSAHKKHCKSAPNFYIKQFFRKK